MIGFLVRKHRLRVFLPHFFQVFGAVRGHKYLGVQIFVEEVIDERVVPSDDDEIMSYEDGSIVSYEDVLTKSSDDVIPCERGSATNKRKVI